MGLVSLDESIATILRRTHCALLKIGRCTLMKARNRVSGDLEVPGRSRFAVILIVCIIAVFGLSAFLSFTAFVALFDQSALTKLHL